MAFFFAKPRQALVVVLATLFFGIAVVAVLGGVRRPGRSPDSGETHRLIAEAAPLITAIERYQSETGHPPASLSALHPHYLEQIPRLTTRAVVGQDYLYAVDPDLYGNKPPQWRLAIPLRGEPDALLTYSSRADYPAGTTRHRVERIGKWAYYHGSPY